MSTLFHLTNAKYSSHTLTLYITYNTKLPNIATVLLLSVCSCLVYMYKFRNAIDVDSTFSPYPEQFSIEWSILIDYCLTRVINFQIRHKANVKDNVQDSKHTAKTLTL